MSNPDLLEQNEIDFLILADKAEVINGKLYMMGGGWDRRRVSDFSRPTSINLAVGVLVPWNLTNEDHQVHIKLEHEDGTVIKPEVKGNFRMGRPAHATRGQQFRALVAVEGHWLLPQPGTYRVVSSIGDSAPKKAVFFAEQADAQAPLAPQGGSG